MVIPSIRCFSSSFASFSSSLCLRNKEKKKMMLTKKIMFDKPSPRILGTKVPQNSILPLGEEKLCYAPKCILWCILFVIILSLQTLTIVCIKYICMILSLYKSEQSHNLIIKLKWSNLLYKIGTNIP